jgi:hypothetical protein
MFEMSEPTAKISDTELQARLLRDSIEANEKKRKLEEDIKIADARSKLILENAVRKDIEAYKKRSIVPKLS